MHRARKALIGLPAARLSPSMRSEGAQGNVRAMVERFEGMADRRTKTAFGVCASYFPA